MSRVSCATAASGIFAILALLAPLTACDNEDGSRRAALNMRSQHAHTLARANPTGRLVLSGNSASLASEHQLVPSGAKSLLALHERLGAGEYVWDDTGVAPGTLLIWIDLERQLISIFRAGHEIGTSVILYGAGDHPTPLGRFSILRKDRDYHSRSYDAPMPYALFVTDDGVALHASPQGVGRATHGCIGLPERFAKLVFDNSSIGDKVTIVKTERVLSEQVSTRLLET